MNRSLPRLLDYVAGETSEPAIRLSASLYDPNDGAFLEPQVASSGASVERALSAASEAHASQHWARLRPDARANVLEQIASAVEARGEAMAWADARTTGVVVSLTQRLAAIAPHAFRGAAMALRAGVLESTLPGPRGDVEVSRHPWGPAAVIAPWNAPAAIAAHKIASALAAGCPVIVKPSEFAPHACALLAEAIASVELPRGVFQVVHGLADVGAQLVSDSRVAAVSFTGGLAGGLSIASATAKSLKPTQLELGGNNPLLVLEDADVDRASRGLVTGLVTLNGQWCRAVGRVFVHAKLFSALMARTLELLAKVKLGSSLSPESEMGPLVHAAHKERVVRAIAALARKGATVHRSTRMPDMPGTFLVPTLVSGCSDDEARDEIFGPVATVHSFESDDEAVARANASPFGLAGYVFGRDEARALEVARRVRAGSVKVNGVSLTSLHPLAPRPAWGLSGVGDEGTHETIRFFTGARVVGLAGDAP